MPFTDDDLRRFKIAFVDRTRIDSFSIEGPEKHLRGLVARLEAAERIAVLAPARWGMSKILNDLVEAWRKAAGK